MKLTVVYDNNAERGLKSGWGFSCLIENKKNILFDTGDNGKKLVYNLKKLNKNIEDIDFIVLSHEHWDHIDGLDEILNLNKNLTVIVPESFSEKFKNKIKEKAKLKEIKDEEKIVNDIYTTGELNSSIGLKEQSLVIKTKKGNILITGCAHPGIVNVVRKARELSDKNIYLVLGGFHLSGISDSELNSIIKDFKELGVHKVAPCHCSGERCQELFKREYKHNFIEDGAGGVIRI